MVSILTDDLLSCNTKETMIFSILSHRYLIDTLVVGVHAFVQWVGEVLICLGINVKALRSRTPPQCVKLFLSRWRVVPQLEIKQVEISTFQLASSQRPTVVREQKSNKTVGIICPWRVTVFVLFVFVLFIFLMTAVPVLTSAWLGNDCAIFFATQWFAKIMHSAMVSWISKGWIEAKEMHHQGRKFWTHVKCCAFLENWSIDSVSVLATCLGMRSSMLDLLSVSCTWTSTPSSSTAPFCVRFSRSLFATSINLFTAHLNSSILHADATNVFRQQCTVSKHLTGMKAMVTSC